MPGVKLEAIRPRKSPAYDLKAFNAALEAALDDTAKAMIKDFKRTTATWETEVVFEAQGKTFRVGSRDVSLIVGTNSLIYKFVSRGTPPHSIDAHNTSGRLLFRTNYTPKTKPGRFLSKEGGASGGFVSPKSVQHPGTEPRHFEELVAYKHGDTLQKNVMRRWDVLIKKG